jgi:predicted phosphate transport protein (TIGR00153 family)
MPRFSFVPRDRDFFGLFEEAGANIERVGGLLERLMARWPDDEGLVREILICEQEGDRITHDIIHRLNATSVTPIDREDIYSLASVLDDIVDFAEEVADYLGLYRIEAPTTQAQELTEVLAAACRNVSQALGRLEDRRELNHFIVEINRLENDGDRIVREAIASLFAGGIDPTVIIRWKDLYERLENAIDACEHASNLLEGIVVKNA